LRLSAASGRAAGGAAKAVLEATAFGLHLQLPQGLISEALRPAEPDDRRPVTVVSVAEEELSGWASPKLWRLREMRRHGHLSWSVDLNPDRGYLFDAPGFVAATLTLDGRAIRCHPQRGGVASSWPSYLGAQVLPLAATIQGLEVLHASAVSVGGEALVFCAAAGSGKTSLAAALVLRGAQLLGDDAVAIDDQLVCHPSAGGLHLRDDAVATLGPVDRARLGIGGERRVDGRAIGSLEPAAPAPLRAVYMLAPGAAVAGIETMREVAPTALLAATFNLSVRSPQRLAHHLDLCARLAAEVPLRSLAVVAGGDVGALADQVLACR
jgi:hypothetical protein